MVMLEMWQWQNLVVLEAAPLSAPNFGHRTIYGEWMARGRRQAEVVVMLVVVEGVKCPVPCRVLAIVLAVAVVAVGGQGRR